MGSGTEDEKVCSQEEEQEEVVSVKCIVSLCYFKEELRVVTDLFI